nr:MULTISPECIES: hypothetical protein [Dehalobacter]
MQAEDDDTVRKKSVDYINKHVSSDKKTIKYFHEGGHLILLSPMAEQVLRCVADFMQDQSINFRPKVLIKR